ncbi:Protease prsW family protein [Paenibacillus sp. UNCCL117]|nr:Protease prsW family protein [Paenibacillus sp. cl123]SFW14086.1 Protease prsW family protein [Paenibacillus sp. UNCCL117]
MLRLFFFGVLIVFPVIVLQRAFMQGFGDHPFVFAFISSSLPEEFMKWFIVYFVIFKHTNFDEPYDGIVYAVAVSLGFATLENVLYALLNSMDFASLLMRAFLPVSGHAMFGVMMGYHFGRAKFDPNGSFKHLAMAFFLPFFWHGAFDYTLYAAKGYWIWFMVPLMVFLWLRSLLKVKRANAKSPLRMVTREDRIKI